MIFSKEGLYALISRHDCFGGITLVLWISMNFFHFTCFLHWKLPCRNRESPFLCINIPNICEKWTFLCGKRGRGNTFWKFLAKILVKWQLLFSVVFISVNWKGYGMVNLRLCETARPLFKHPIPSPGLGHWLTLDLVNHLAYILTAVLIHYVTFTRPLLLFLVELWASSCSSITYNPWTLRCPNYQNSRLRDGPSSSKLETLRL